MGLLPVADRGLGVLWHSTVVDLAPVSRAPGNRGTSDEASITTVFSLELDEDGPVVLLAPGHYETHASCRRLDTRGDSVVGERIDDPDAVDEIRAGLRAMATETDRATDGTERVLSRMRIAHRFELELEAGVNVMRFSTRLPIIQEDDGTYVFSCLYPGDLAGLVKDGDFSATVLLPRAGDGTEVRLEWWDEPDGATVTIARGAAPGERTTVTWFGQQDPPFQLGYLYWP